MIVSSKLQRTRILRYIVASRWFLHAGILVLGLTQKAIGVKNFDPNIFYLIGFTYTYNFIFYMYLRRPSEQLTNNGLNIVSVVSLVLDQLLYTVILFSTGGVESLSFLFYFLTIFIAIVLFTEFEIIAFTLFTVTLYISVISFEYLGFIPHNSRYNFDPGFYQNIGVTVSNSATIVLIFVFTAFFAAFISNLIRTRETSIASERDKVSSIVDNLVDGVILLNPQGEVMLMNPYAQRILHVSPSQLDDQRLHTDYFPTALHELLDFINTAAQNPVYRSEEITLIDKSDRLILRVTTLQITNSLGQTFGSLVILRNITREKDLDQLKSEFISVAAHQLRTPLATLKWLFKILLDGDGGDITEKQRDLLSKGYRRNNEVIEIVNNLLDVSEIEDGRFPFKFRTLPVNTVVDSVMLSATDNAERSNVHLNFTGDDTKALVNLDKQKLRMALTNLIDNAIKYSFPEGTVWVEMKADSTQNEVTISVRDEGIGMSEQTRAKLFTKFFRGKEAAIKEPTGSGLGLYIVRNIIERHGGIIEVESKLDKGTTFTVSLPIVQQG